MYHVSPSSSVETWPLIFEACLQNEVQQWKLKWEFQTEISKAVKAPSKTWKGLAGFILS